MFGSIRTVFASRWKALWWAIGVCLTAYCTVPSADAPSSSQAQAQKHVNPWAKGYNPQAQVEPESSVDELRALIARTKEGPPPKEENPWAVKKPDQHKG